MKDKIIEIFGKKVKIIEDAEDKLEEGCRNCVFMGMFGCSINYKEDSMLCTDSSGKTNKHFELA